MLIKTLYFKEELIRLLSQADARQSNREATACCSTEPSSACSPSKAMANGSSQGLEQAIKAEMAVVTPDTVPCHPVLYFCPQQKLVCQCLRCFHALK